MKNHLPVHRIYELFGIAGKVVIETTTAIGMCATTV